MITKLTANYHTHTKYCSHAQGEISEYVEEAIKQGFTELGFSDHGANKDLPVFFTIGKNQDQYLHDIIEAKEKYKDKITIYAGLEMDFFSEFIPYYKSLLNRFDYLGLSCHFYKYSNINKELYKRRSHNLQIESEIEAYTNLLCEGIKTRLFRMAYHPDIFIGLYTPFVRKYALRIVTTAIENNCLLELNMSQIYNELVLPNIDYKEHPRYEFWKVVSEKQAKVIINSDAHIVSNLYHPNHDLAFKIANELNLNIVKGIFE